MSDLNLCVMTGRLGQDIELKHTQSGTAVCSPSIAVGGRKKEGDQWVESVEWVPLVMWQRTAEIAAQYLKKGSQIRITGRFQTRSWEQDGVKRYKSEIVVSEMQMLGSKSDSPGQGGYTSAPQQQTPGQSATQASGAAQAPTGGGPDFDDDVPF